MTTSPDNVRVASIEPETVEEAEPSSPEPSAETRSMTVKPTATSDRESVLENLPVSDPQPAEVTQLLHAWTQGDPDALADLMPLVCDELRSRARRYLDRENRQHTLQPTALVNEIYLRFERRHSVHWKNRAQFFGYAAKMMRQVLVDHARAKNRDKRGSGQRPVSFDADFHKEPVDPKAPSIDLVALNVAVDALEALDPRQARIVELRFIVGLTVEETAAALEISTATVKREWRLARLWLYREMGGR